jgi:hypothetical protein
MILDQLLSMPVRFSLGETLRTIMALDGHKINAAAIWEVSPTLRH